MDEALAKLRAGANLSVEQSRRAFEEIMSGQVAEDVLAEFLTLLADKGETVAELIGAATVMREKATRICCRAADAIDTCGTGGDGISTFNISTTAGLIAAAAGATVAKHGNRSNTRVSGSAEVLTELGVNVDTSPEVMERCLSETRFAFLYAPRLHPAMRFAAPVRKRLGRRTIFNLLGPLCNPAGVTRQLLGVSRPELVAKMAAALRGLGARRALVVHGDGGLCDLTTSGPSRAAEVQGMTLTETQIDAAGWGVPRGTVEDLLVDSPAASAAAVRDVLDGRPGPRRDAALLNAAAALLVADRCDSLHDGMILAAAAVDGGGAKDLLARIVAITSNP